jgi:hypothetical protein
MVSFAISASSPSYVALSLSSLSMLRTMQFAKPVTWAPTTMPACVPPELSEDDVVNAPIHPFNCSASSIIAST